jgi:hypothetical protein
VTGTPHGRGFGGGKDGLHCLYGQAVAERAELAVLLPVPAREVLGGVGREQRLGSGDQEGEEQRHLVRGPREGDAGGAKARSRALSGLTAGCGLVKGVDVTLAAERPRCRTPRPKAPRAGGHPRSPARWAPTGTPAPPLSEVRGAAHRQHPRAIEHMGVDHRRRHLGVAQELLHGADVVARLEQMGGEGMPQCVVVDPFVGMPAASAAALIARCSDDSCR